jgi:hypothetical protein
MVSATQPFHKDCGIGVDFLKEKKKKRIILCRLFLEFFLKHPVPADIWRPSVNGSGLFLYAPSITENTEGTISV